MAECTDTGLYLIFAAKSWFLVWLTHKINDDTAYEIQKMVYNKAQQGCSDVTCYSSVVCSESDISWLLYTLSILVNQTCKDGLLHRRQMALRNCSVKDLAGDWMNHLTICLSPFIMGQTSTNQIDSRRRLPQQSQLVNQPLTKQIYWNGSYWSVLGSIMFFFLLCFQLIVVEINQVDTV